MYFRSLFLLFSMYLKIWPTTLTSKSLCLVYVPLWRVPYAILITIYLYMFTHVDNYIMYLFLELFTFIIFTNLISLPSVYG